MTFEEIEKAAIQSLAAKACLNIYKNICLADLMGSSKEVMEAWTIGKKLAGDGRDYYSKDWKDEMIQDQGLEE